MTRMGGARSLEGKDRLRAEAQRRRLVREVAVLKRALAQCRAEVAAAHRQEAEDVAARWGLQLREVDHRAKNSLQLAASMLVIHGKTTEDAAVRRHLETAAERLTILARLHAVLHEEVESRGVPVRPWLERVCEGLHPGPQVDIAIVAPDEPWPVEFARPVGLFTFEAVTNALKHGFSDGLSGRIDVSLVRLRGRHRLEVVDNGRGAQGAACSGLGLTLCQIFADQLSGDFSIADGPGARGFRAGVDFIGPARPRRAGRGRVGASRG